MLIDHNSPNNDEEEEDDHDQDCDDEMKINWW